MINDNKNFKSKQKQKGMSTLLVAVILLAVLLVLSLFATRFQVFETRASTNKVRAEMAASVTEAALNQGLEYIKSNARFITSDRAATASMPVGWLNEANPSWEPCTAAVDAGVFDPCLAEPNEDRRENMYRFIRDGSTRLPLTDSFGADQLFDQVGRFDAEYAVHATLCLVDVETNPAAPDCVLEPENPGPTAIMLVARGGMPGENARMTMRHIVASSRIIANPPNVPLIAAGIVSGLGSAEIVPNPDGGGAGVPLSIWTNENVDITKEVGGAGAFMTCHLGEFLSNFSGGGGPEEFDGITKCENCSCNGLGPEDGLISGKDPGTPGYEGQDVMDVDGNANGDLPDTSFFPSEGLDNNANGFDDSVFEYTFGADVVNEGETAVKTDCVSDENPGGNCETQFIIDANAIILASCDSLDASSSGLYWITGDCDINQVVGSPSYPVGLIVDGCLSVMGQTEFYGLLYTRGGRGGCTDPDKAFSAAGGGQLYGAIVVDGGVKIRGSVQMIYNDTVLKNLGNSPAFVRYGVLPGSWTDDVCPADSGRCGEN